MTYEKRMQRLLIACGAVLAIGLIFIPYWGGALAMLVVILTAVGTLVVHRRVALKFARTLAQVGEELGLHCATREDDARYRELASAAAKAFETSTRTWKVDGRFPCLIGYLNNFLVTVRVPFGYQFDRRARETTRIAVHHRNNYEGFVVISRAGLAEEPPRLLHTDDPAFDDKFVVSGRRAEEAAECLSPEARAALMRLADTGLGGIRVTPYGIFYHAPGRVVSAETIKRVLTALCAMAANIPARDPLHRRGDQQGT